MNFEMSTDLLDITEGIDLVGTLIADIEPGVGGIKAALMSIWRTLGQIRILRVKPNTYNLIVGTEKLARKLLSESPWNVKGYCFTIKHWPRYHSINDLDDKRATYWIQGHGIPRDQITVNNGRILGNMLGSVMEVEDPKITGNMDFIQKRVDFDTRKPLATFVNLPRPNMPSARIYLKYEI